MAGEATLHSDITHGKFLDTYYTAENPQDQKYENAPSLSVKNMAVKQRKHPDNDTNIEKTLRKQKL